LRSGERKALVYRKAVNRNLYAGNGAISKRRDDTMRKLWILAFVLGLPCAASAQWENLNTLRVGQKIQVIEVNSKKDSGTFLSVSDKTISLQGKSSEQTVRRQDVRSVKLMENKHRLRNALIGGAVGAGAGAGIGAATYSSCTSTNTFCINPIGRGGLAGIGAVVGLAAGASVGALWPSHESIYRAQGP
jgi:hypothetical protein